MKLILASHGDLCTGMLSSYQMIAGVNKDIAVISLTDAGIEDFVRRFNTMLDEFVRTHEVLIITDIKGGTPYNEAFNYFLRKKEKVRVISGMNLPMVIETGLNLQTKSLGDLYSLALDIGRSGIEGAEEIETQTDDIEF
ncbi:PTS sugar transporter subunit IIA [Enterococcus sp. BWB1-3]|uniref:PTS sugar transporter subunit IIA n=1 Tax=unclassified Enterococcus TaxID=2608891 RepID=UPI0019209937|nr:MULTISPECIES: PTS sugar transporter subunit IIA [unclassified Enterococcus]MBL1229674.1 PTS sugar transporter subunit IIA [Enterococcus sp. BWB1-3]MCB5953812.1 PTS sugar transporter subunit IIA [Enterococcus sp. CWB-B31]